MRKKKLFSIITLVCFLFTLMPVTVLADIAFVSDESTVSRGQVDTDSLIGVINADQQKVVEQLLDSYFLLKAEDFDNATSESWTILKNKLNDAVYQGELERLKAVLNWKLEGQIVPTDIQYSYKVKDAALVENQLNLTMHEHLDITYGPTAMDIMGFGTEHEITMLMEEDIIIAKDTYTEWDLWGYVSSDYVEPVNQHEELLENETEQVQTFARTAVQINYDADAAVRYANEYALKYNDYANGGVWPNMNDIGGDCANFLSQCLYAGGLPMTSAWYCYDKNNHSGSWTSSTLLREYLMSSGIGVYEFTPTKASDFEKGMPIFWDSKAIKDNVPPTGTWWHSQICVGFNSSGIPVYNSHNADRYQALMYSSNYKYCRCVQMPDGSTLPGTPVLKNMQTEYSSILGVDFNWDDVSNAVRYALIIDRWDDTTQTYVRNWEHWWIESGVNVVLEEGSYRAYVRAASQNGNDLYWGDGEIAMFTVYEDTVTPGKPVLQNMQSSYSVYEGITFNWEPTVNTTNYGLRISRWDESTDEWVRVVTNWYAEDGIHYDLEAGTYNIIFQSINATNDEWVSNFDEERIVEVYIPEAGTTNLKDMRTNYSEVSGVDFIWESAENAIQYALVIDSFNTESQQYERYWQNWNAESGIHLDLEAGSYRAYVRCASGSADELKWSGEGVISYFTVDKDITTPGRPALKNMKTVYDVSTGIYFQWDETINTTNYGLLIDQWDETQNDYVRYISNWYAESGIYYELPAGKYRVAMQSVNDSNGEWLYTQSSPYWTEFEVTIATPGHTLLNDLQETYTTSDEITFLWDYPEENTTRYALIISKLDEVSQMHVEYSADLWAESGKQITLPEGSYKVDLRTANGFDEDWIWLDADTQYFDVVEDEQQQTDTMKFIVDSSTIIKGGTTKTKVSVTNNPGIAVLTAEVVYDADIITPVAVLEGTLGEGTLTSNISDVETMRKLYITWCSKDGGNITGDGNLFTIEWKTVEAFSESAGSSSVSLIFSDDAICNSEEELLFATTKDGEIQIQNYLPGDIYIDNAINMKDILCLARYMNKQEILTAQQFYAADLNNDGKVNSIDVMRLVKQLSSAIETGVNFNSDGMLKSNAAGIFSNNAYEILIGDISLDANGDANVTVQGKNCPGISAFRFIINVPEGCTIDGVIPSDLLQRGSFEFNKDSNIVCWYATNDQILDGPLFTVKLHSESSKADLELQYNPDDISDEMFNTINTTITKIENDSMLALGDINGDKNINIVDAMMIVQHIQGVINLSDNVNADVDGDGNITITDAMKIVQHIQGVIEL